MKKLMIPVCDLIEAILAEHGIVADLAAIQSQGTIGIARWFYSLPDEVRDKVFLLFHPSIRMDKYTLGMMIADIESGKFKP